MLLPPKDTGKQQTTTIPPRSPKVALITQSIDLKEKKPTTSANIKKIPFKWENSGSRAATNKQKHQALVSQRYRNQAKENLNLIANVDAYSYKASKLLYLMIQQRAQLLVLNGFKELVLAKQTDRTMEVLGRHPQVIFAYAFKARYLLTTSLTTNINFQYIQIHRTVCQILWQLPCFNNME